MKRAAERHSGRRTRDPARRGLRLGACACLAILAAGPLLVSPVGGQGRPPERSEVERARMLGALTATVVSVSFDDVPARDAFRAIGRAIGVSITGGYRIDRIRHGIDPDLPVTLSIEETDALTVLELVLEQCAIDDACTWQLRDGFVEVGTKERLAAPAAAETRTYHIRDLLIEPPYYEGPTLGGPGIGFDAFGGFGGVSGGIGARLQTVSPVDDFEHRPYASAVLSKPTELKAATWGREARKRPEQLAQEIVAAIVELIEPGNWDYGQFAEDSATGLRSGARVSNRKIARLRLVQNTLVIRAPDFIHRQINGYPRPIPPRVTDEQIVERSAAASTESCTVIVHGIDLPDVRRRGNRSERP